MNNIDQEKTIGNRLNSILILFKNRINDKFYAINFILSTLVLIFGNIFLFLKLNSFLVLIFSIPIYTYYFMHIGKAISRLLIPNEKSYFTDFVFGFILMSSLYFFISLIHLFHFWTFFVLFNCSLLVIWTSSIVKIIQIRNFSLVDELKNLRLKLRFKNNIPILMIISAFLILQFFLCFIGGQIGVDTFRINFLAYILIRDKYLSFAPNFLSMIQLVPYSQFPAPVVQIASFSLLTNLSMDKAVFLCNIFLGLTSIIGTWKLFSLFFGKKSKSTYFAVIFYTFSPLFMKFNYYSITGRSIVFCLLPFAIYLGEKTFRQKNRKEIFQYTFFNGLLFILLFFAHRMAFAFLAFYIFRVAIFLLKKITNKQENVIIISNIFSVIGLVLISIPILLFVFGNNSLIFQWFERYLEDFIFFFLLKNSSSTVYNFMPIFTNYSLYFIIRTLIVIPLMFIDIFSIRKKTNKLLNNIVEDMHFYLASKIIIVLLFPLLFRSMFIYQSIILFYTFHSIISIQSINSVLDRIISKISNSDKTVQNKKIFQKNKQKIVTISLALIFIASSFTIELKRYDYFVPQNNVVEYLTEDIRDIAEYLDTHFGNTVFYTEVYDIALQLSALCPQNFYLPNQKNIYQSYNLVDINQKPVFQGWPNSLNELYELIFLPFTFNEIVNAQEIVSIRNYNYTSLSDVDILYTLLAKYEITHVISLKNQTTDIFFIDLNENGNIIYNNTLFNVIDLNFVI